MCVRVIDCVCACVCVCLRACMCSCVRACVRACMCVCLHVCVYECTYPGSVDAQDPLAKNVPLLSITWRNVVRHVLRERRKNSSLPLQEDMYTKFTT